MTKPTVVVGKKWDKGAVYIGRGSPFGNPFRLPAGGKEHLRNSACDAYDKHFWEHWVNDPEFVEELESLVQQAKRDGHLILGCFCAPKRCHGETIKSYIDQRLSEALHEPVVEARVGLRLRDLI